MDKEYQHPIYLICDHCKQRVETGILTVSDHSLNCPVYFEQDIYNSGGLTGIKMRLRPNPSFTSIYETN